MNATPPPNFQCLLLRIRELEASFGTGAEMGDSEAQGTRESTGRRKVMGPRSPGERRVNWADRVTVTGGAIEHGTAQVGHQTRWLVNRRGSNSNRLRTSIQSTPHNPLSELILIDVGAVVGIVDSGISVSVINSSLSGQNSGKEWENTTGEYERSRYMVVEVEAFIPFEVGWENCKVRLKNPGRLDS